MTRNEAIAACRARGLREPECAALADDRMVGGVYCDGTIVMGADGTRCVPRSTLDAKAAARAASPLPAPVLAHMALPSSPWPWIVGALCASVVLALVFRKG